jgi:hypothetical protein
VRLSVKKAAYADVSRAAYRKSGVVLGRLSTEISPEGTAENDPGRQSRTSVLGELDHTGMPWQSSKANPILPETTDAYNPRTNTIPDLLADLDSSDSQPSLRDCRNEDHCRGGETKLSGVDNSNTSCARRPAAPLRLQSTYQSPQTHDRHWRLVHRHGFRLTVIAWLRAIKL